MKYTNKIVPYSGIVYEIPNVEFKKHEKRVTDLDKSAKQAVSTGKATDYAEECERLTDIQARKITTLEKLYGRYLVAEDMGYDAIAKAFLKKYRFLTQTRGDKISNIFDDL